MIQLNSQHSSRLQEFFKLMASCLPVYLALETLGRILEAAFEPLAAQFGNTSGRSEDSIALMAAFVVVSTIWALLSGAIRLLTVRDSLALGKSQLTRTRRVNLLMIESTRAMASVMFRIPLLILPALLQWIRLAPLPYLVLLSRSYESGEADALQLSSKFASRYKRLTILIAALPLFTLIPEFLFTTNASAASSFLHQPFQHIGSILTMSTIKLAFDALILNLVSRKLTHIEETCRIES